jgi:hypothetical protein
MSDTMIVVVLGAVALTIVALWLCTRYWTKCKNCGSWFTKTRWKSSGADASIPNLHHYYASYYCYRCGSEAIYLHTVVERNREVVMSDRW